MKMATLVLVSLMSLSFPTSAIVPPFNSEALLLNHVFANYSSKVRPVLNHSQPVNVELDLMLRQIIDVDMVNEVLTTNVWIRMFWKSELTTWNPNDFEGLKSINVEPKMVWVPDLIIYNRASTSETDGSLYRILDTNIILEHTGKVTWLSPAILKTECVINVRHFPFDSHQCPLTVGSWTHHKGKISLNVTRDVIDTEAYSHDKEWHLEATTAISQTEKFNCCPTPFSVVTFSLIIKRRSTFYVFNLIIPCGLITVLTLFSFLLPPNSGERVSFVITILLSLSVYMLIVTEKIPQSADIPISSKLFMCMMVEISLSLIATCFIIRIHNYNMPMPSSFKLFVNGWLARVLCMEKDRRHKKQAKISSCREVAENRGFDKDDDDDVYVTRIHYQQNGMTMNDATSRENKEKRSTTEDPGAFDIPKGITKCSNNSIEKEEELQSEWVHASNVLDRFFILVLFLSICITLLWISLASREHTNLVDQP